MAKRARSTRRRSNVQRKPARSVKRVRRSRKLTQSTVYRYSRWADAGATLASSLLSSGYAFTGSLDNVQGYTEFQNLYDQFKITGVLVTFQLINHPDVATNLNDGSTFNSTNWFPKLWYITDSDDNTTPTLAGMRERQGVKVRILRPNQTVKMFLHPKVLVQTYRTSTSTGYAPKSMFLDMATGYNVPHYALKYVVDANGQSPSASFPFTVRVEYKYYLAFKGVL